MKVTGILPCASDLVDAGVVNSPRPEGRGFRIITPRQLGGCIRHFSLPFRHHCLRRGLLGLPRPFRPQFSLISRASRPRWRIVRAALVSACSWYPHDRQENRSRSMRDAASTMPQHPQVREVFRGSTTMRRPSDQDSLQASWRRISPQPLSRMARFIGPWRPHCGLDPRPCLARRPSSPSPSGSRSSPRDGASRYGS